MSRSSHNSPVQITDSRKRFLLLVHDRCRLFASRFFLRVTRFANLFILFGRKLGRFPHEKTRKRR